MAKFCGALVVAVMATPLLVSSADAQPGGRLILLDCVGMELSQNADGDNAAPDDNGQPDSDAPEGNAQAPGDDGAVDGGDGADQDQASPPDSAQPPGCIFQNRPLELIV